MIRTVLLVHPDEAKRREVRSWLAGADVVEAANRPAALEVLQRTPPAFVFLHYEEVRRLLRDLERHAPAAVRAVLCPDDAQLRASLARVVAEGYDFITVDAQAADAVRSLVFTRTSARLAPRVSLVARLREPAVSCEIVELSSDGAGLRAPTDAPLDRLVPGTRLEGAVYGAGGALVMEPRPWLVRTVRHEKDHVVLGVTFAPEAGAPPPAPVTDAVRVTGWVQRAVLKQARVEVSDGVHVAAFARSVVEQETGRVVLEQLLDAHAPPPWRAGDIVQASFDVGRLHTECMTSVIDAREGALVLAAPRTAVQRERRQSMRIHLGDSTATLGFRSPLSGARSTRRLLDLQPGGAAFSFDAQSETLPPGLRLGEVELSLDGVTFRCEAVVQSTRATGDDHHARRCGVRLRAQSPEGRQALLDALGAFLVPETRDSHRVPFEQVWQLFVDERARFPDHPPGPATLAVLGEAQRRVQADGGLSRSFVFREGGAVLGHASGLRPYSRTWFSQHLLVRAGYHRSAHVSQTLVNLTFDYGEALDDIEYLRGTWRVGNRWAARIYGIATPRLVRPGYSYVHRYQVLRRPADGVDPGPLRAAQTEEAGDFLSFARARVDPVKLAADDLLPATFWFPELRERYARAGLERTRALALVEDDGRPRGWVVLEHLSRGLFWMELFTSARLFLVEPGAPDAAEVTRALVAFAAEHARARGLTSLTVVADPEQAPSLAPLGFTDLLGPALEFCAHTSMAREMTSELLNIFERLELRSALRGRRDAAEAGELAEGQG